MPRDPLRRTSRLQDPKGRQRARALSARVRAVAAVVVVGAVLLAGQAAFGRVSVHRTVQVQWGDSLWAISQRYGVDMRQLASTNHMRISDVLYAGSTLTLPGARVSTANTAPGAVSPVGTSVAARLLERSFCATYRPPTRPQGQLPPGLGSDPTRLALRPVFVKWARTFRVPADLIEADAWQESGWNNAVVSTDGAVGIGQLLPKTAADVNDSLGTHLKLTVPSDNVEMMAAFFGQLLQDTGGDVCGAVASYYQGFSTWQRYGVLPVTQLYVRNVLSLRPRFR